MSETPPPTRIQRGFTAILPQFIAYSRKGLIWFSSLSAVAIAEFVKTIGGASGWTDAQVLQWNNRMLLLQGAVLLVAKFWTDQIAKEDSALKAGLPPPQTVTGGNITVLPPPPPSPPPIQGLPPRGEGKR